MSSPKKTKKTNSNTLTWNDVKVASLMFVGMILTSVGSMLLFLIRTIVMAVILTMPLLWTLQHMPWFVSPVCLSNLNPTSAFALSAILVAIVLVLFPKNEEKE